MWPLPFTVGGGLCTEAPSLHWFRKGRQGSVASLHPRKQGGDWLLGLGSEATGRKLRGHAVCVQCHIAGRVVFLLLQ